MAKLQRKSAKLFAEQATAGIGGIAQFGSLAAGDPNYSKDPDVIQALDAYKEGWSTAVTGNKSPAIEDRNALDYLLSYQQAYIMQHGIPEWISTETYYINSYVVDANGELRVSTIDNNINHNPTEDEGGQYWGFAGARGSGKRIGEVYFSQSSSATNNPGALPLFTGEIISNVDKLYPQFYSWLQNNTGVLRTQEYYELLISQYGECPFYVLDTINKTLRLPILKNFIKMADRNLNVQVYRAGLPNITGTANMYPNNGSPDNTGAFSLETGSGNGGNETWSTCYKLKFDASKSNSIYGNSNTVRPPCTSLFPWVCAYNAAVPASIAQAAEFQEALSSKADIDLINLSTAGENKIQSLCVGNFDLTSGISITSGYVTTQPGWIYINRNFSGSGNQSDISPRLYFDNVQVGAFGASARDGRDGYFVAAWLTPVREGITVTAINFDDLIFYPNI